MKKTQPIHCHARSTFLILLTLFLQSISYATPPIVPQPLECTPAEGSFTLNVKTRIVLSHNAAKGATDAAYHLSSELKTRYSLLVPVVIKSEEMREGNIYFSWAAPRDLSPGVKKTLAIKRDWLGPEGYALSADNAMIHLHATSRTGFLYAVNTLLQMADKKPTGLTIPAVSIKDKPRFTYRGLMLDPSRGFLEPNYIRRTIDMMAYIKMNKLHLHLTDDQSFRIEVKSHPELAKKATPDGKYYSQDEMRKIIAYASDRGIEIIPEFDMPAHATAWLHAIPALHCLGKQPPLRTKMYGNDKLAFCVSRPESIAFLNDFFSEMAALFPSKLIHIGGDEVIAGSWDACDSCMALAKKNNWDGDVKTRTRNLQNAFLSRIQSILKKNGKTMMGWEEITHIPNLAPDAVAEHWHWERNQLKKMLTDRRNVVLSRLKNNRMYFDYAHEKNSIAALYEDELLPPDLTASEIELIKGVEACMWCYEQEHIDYLTWPRLFVTAEYGWSQPATKDTEAFLKRSEKTLGDMKIRWNLDNGPLRPPYKNRANIPRSNTF